MAKKIGAFAVYAIDDTGETHWFAQGSEPPAWAAKQLGDHCFEGGEGVFDEAGANQPVVHADAITPEAADADESDGPPPKAGKGSGEDKWRAYAERHGVDVSEAEGRDDVIAALEDAGVAVE
jgi:hypothetical protein